MEQELRTLIGKYGYRAVHEGLLREMRQQFEYLSTVFHPVRNEIVVPMVTETIPEPITTPKHSPMEILANMKELALPPPTIDIVIEKMEVNEDSTGGERKDIQITGKATTNVVSKKYSKDEHKAEVMKKRKELEEKGIKPETLLTKENLQSWLDQGMSYQRIARELVGIHENDISAIAKSFGLQSNVSRYIFMRKNK